MFCRASSKHAARCQVQLKPDLRELVLIIIDASVDASVEWEFTAWPRMDMANVAVSHLVTGHQWKDNEPRVVSFRSSQRVLLSICDGCLSFTEPIAIICKGGVNFSM